MTTDQSCPICGLEKISPDKAQCPQCDADLACFKALDAIPDELPTAEKHPKTGIIPLVAIILVIALIIVMAVFQFYRFKQMERLLADHKNSIASMDKKLENLRVVSPGLEDGERLEDGGERIEDRGQKLENGGERLEDGGERLEDRGQKLEDGGERIEDGGRIEDESEAVSLSFWTYIANDEDTLWDIAEAHYGSGYYYPVLLEHNPHIGIYYIGKGIPLKILKDTLLVKAIYRKIIIKEGDNIYWNYTVVEGDTIRSVIAKFYNIKNVEKQIAVFNPDTQLEPGKKIKILLK